MKSFIWYINRLSKMPPQEILYRVGHKFAEKRDKARFWHESPFCPYSSYATISSRLFELQSFSHENIEKGLDGLGKELVPKADLVLMNRIGIFGSIHDFGDAIDWHLDVKTGCHWPLSFWADINIRDGFTVGGPKFVWETNRLYGLHILGLAYRRTGNERYAAKIFSLISDWLEANPYPQGVNWTSGIELGTRIANLVWGLAALAGRLVSSEETELVNQFVWLHGRHLYRYPSKYSSNNNHAIAEAFALFLIGVYFPGFPEAEKWLSFGKEVLDREAGRQILPDGGSYEYSTTYLSFVFDFFLLYKLVCEKNDITYGAQLDARLEKACEFIHTLMDKNGNMPNIGDQDSAVLVNFGLDNHENFRSILNTGSVLYDRPDFCRDDFPDLKTSILVGDRIKNACTPKIKHSDYRTILFPESGLTVIRGEMAGKEYVFAGNATPLGMPPLYAHGHLDALSFTLTVEGLEIFVDPGTYLYHSGGKWRRYFRSTAAHNTIRINGLDMTEQVADFMFGRPYRIIHHTLQEDHDGVVWQAGHDAYQKLKTPVTHMRKVVFKKDHNGFEIIDSLTCQTGFMVEQYFHFHPQCVVRVKEDMVFIERESVRLEMTCGKGLQKKIFKGSQEPLLGWYSRAFNHLEESPSLVCRGAMKGDLELRTQCVLRVG